MTINILKALLLREILEYKGILIKAPLYISILMIIFACIGIYQFSIHNNGLEKNISYLPLVEQYIDSENSINHNTEETEIKNNVQRFIIKFISPILFISISIGIFTSLFYCLYSLYTDRKDRSILFWRSLPLSEANQITVKLIIGIFFYPFIYLVVSSIFIIFLLVVLSIGAFVNGFFNVFNNIFIEALLLLPNQIFIFLCMIFIFNFSFLVLYTWLLFCSAFSKRNPTLMAIGLPILIFHFEGFLFGSKYIMQSITVHLKHLFNNSQALFHLNISDIHIWSYFISLCFSASLLFATNWLRNNRYEI